MHSSKLVIWGSSWGRGLRSHRLLWRDTSFSTASSILPSQLSATSYLRLQSLEVTLEGHLVFYCFFDPSIAAFRNFLSSPSIFGTGDLFQDGIVGVGGSDLFGQVAGRPILYTTTTQRGWCIEVFVSILVQSQSQTSLPGGGGV